MKLKELAALHKAVIHDNWRTASESDVELEDKWVKKYPYDLLNNVCVDCFSDPDASDEGLVSTASISDTDLV